MKKKAKKIKTVKKTKDPYRMSKKQRQDAIDAIADYRCHLQYLLKDDFSLTDTLTEFDDMKGFTGVYTDKELHKFIDKYYFLSEICNRLTEKKDK